ncbi:MAG: methyltransferase domain-containing protein [Nanoarchaeota archaeon]
MESQLENWINEVWKNAQSSWNNRDQDYNYRNYIVHPALEKEISVLEKLSKDYLHSFVDWGCGEGRETLFLREILEKNNFQGCIEGIDLQESQIEYARIKNRCNTKDKIKIFFSNSFYTVADLNHKIDFIFSLFAMQEIPFLQNFISNIYDTLKENGNLIAIFLNPDFENLLKDKNALRIHNKFKSPEWEYYGEYPIVEKTGCFYVPFFHRPLSKYIETFEKFFFIENIQLLKPSEKLFEKFETEKISPFFEHEHNVYYPEILSKPSSILIRGIKK